MTIIEPLDPAEFESQRLDKVLENFRDLGDLEAIFPRILAHAPGYAKALWNAMDETRLADGLDIRLKEIIRIQLARHAEDPYFSGLRSEKAVAAGLTEDDVEAGSGDFANDDRFSDAEKWALQYAYLMYREPEKVDAAFYDEGKRHFTEAQIMELGGMIAVHYGMQVFMRTLQDRNG
jgi:alkylhydroperoxidase family enzyme